MSDTYTYRAFLESANQGSADSYVRLEMRTRPGGQDKMHANLKIADCNRSIELNFDVGGYSGATKAQRLRKLAKLEKALAAIRTELEAL